VQPATYRLRAINGSNARTYRLVLLRDGAPELERLTQIGTDHGLLRTPAPVPADGLLLAPAERADLLVDFSDLAPGSELTVLNTAAAPFDGTRFQAADAESAADVEGLLPYPEVLHFRVAGEAARRRSIPPELGEYEVWQLINLTGDTHPIHLHLDPFQILARRPIRYEIPAGGIGDRDLAATIKLERDPDDELNHAIDDNERGLKDTVRVNPNEIVEIAV